MGDYNDIMEEIFIVDKFYKELPLVSVNKAKDYPMDLKTSFHRDLNVKINLMRKKSFIDALLSLREKYGLDSTYIKSIIL